MQWFGASWGAPVCDPADHVLVPVGEFCGWCTEIIEANDSGVILPHIDAGRVTPTPHHIECFLRETAGSVAHQLGICKCFGGPERGEMEKNMTRRDAARLAVRCLQVNKTNETVQ